MNNLIVEDSLVNTEASQDTIELGQWYWVLKDEESDNWLGCITSIGSNYVEIESPRNKNGWHSLRVHFNKIAEYLKPELNASQVIKEKVSYYEQQVNQHLAQVKEITSRLGVSKHAAIEHQSQSSQELMVLNGSEHIKAYELELVKAKEETLPELFEKIKNNTEKVGKWLSAESLPIQAMSNGLSTHLDEIDNRIFNVSLYAGLTEDIVQCNEGEPAEMTDRLHVMQRRLYMDEESLLGYRSGGLEFKGINEFDEWLCEEENLNRILPFPRTIVAMRVRRKGKNRYSNGQLMNALINFELGQLDELTFLFIRNGDQLFRMNCDLDFEEMIFPDKTMFDINEPKMVKMFGDRVNKMMSVTEYEDRIKEYTERKAAIKLWEDENPDADWIDRPHNSYFDFHPDNWDKFDQNNVYYDECLKTITDQITQYNRIATIIQGLFDRSEALHPHPPVKSWTPEGFDAAIELVYDGSMVLHHGEAPDFEDYFKRCNELIDADSILIGQDDLWQYHEAEKENERISRNYRYNDRDSDLTRYRPYGNEGPGYIAKPSNIMLRARKVTFTWNRERLQDTHWKSEYVKASITLPLDELFNVSAYKLGDYKQFFQDPRTRSQYLKWAPLLLTAEEYHSGNVKAQLPIK